MSVPTPARRLICCMRETRFLAGSVRPATQTGKISRKCAGLSGLAAALAPRVRFLLGPLV